MKQLYYSLLALCLVSSCASDLDISMTENRKTMAIMTDRRTAAEAVEIANSVVAGESNSLTRSSRAASLLNATPVVVSTTRSLADTVMYAVDYGNDQGFALIATDRSLVPVLAVIDEGKYEDIPADGNENFRIALNAAKNYAASKVTPVLPQPNPTIPDTWYEYSDTIFPKAKREPNIKIQLNQLWPENVYCPNKIAGCGPVASLQIMSFLESPTNITYTFEEKDMTNESIDWGSLRKHKISNLGMTPTQSEINYHYNSCGLGAEGHKTIGRLIRELGHRADSKSDSTGTGVKYSKMISVIQAVTGISPKSRKSGIDNLYSDLCCYPDGVAFVDANGLDNQNKIVSGHFWVADAIWELGMKVRYYYYVSVPGHSDPDLMCYTKDTLKKLIHYNWGWGGRCNGYFMIDIFNPNGAYEYDNTNYHSASDVSYEADFQHTLFVK